MALASPTRTRPWQAIRFPPLRPPWWVILIGLVALALLAWYLWITFTTDQGRVNYQTSQIRRGDVRISVVATGPVANPTSVPLTFKNSGRLAQVNVSLGDRVTAGQILAQLDTTDLLATVEQERARLANLEATEATTRTGPTEEDIAVASATLSAAETQYQSALRDLETTRVTADAAIASAQADVESARVDLANAQRSAESSADERIASLNASQTTLDNARVAYANALKAFQTANEESEKTIAASEAAVNNASQNLAASIQNLAAAEADAAQTLEANRLAVENAKVVLADAERQFADQKTVSEANIAVAQRQLQEQRAALSTQRAQRQQACSSNASSTTSCTVAKRQESAAEASVRTSEAQLAQTRTQANQSVSSAATQITSAQNSLRTAEAAVNSGIASSRQSITSARNQVVSAQNTLKTAQATLESTKAQVANTLASGKTTLDASLNTVLAAQKTFESDRAAQNSAAVTAQNTVDQSQAALQRAQKTLENTRAQQAASVQAAENTARQQAAALEQAQATYAQTVAGPTPMEVEAARASTEAQRQSLRLAENNLAAATLVAPTSGVVAVINGAVGQWVTGGSVNTSSSSTTSVTPTSSAGAVSTTDGFITLTEISDPQVVPQVSEADIGRIQIGQRVSFTLSAYPGRTFGGNVIAIQPVGQTVSNVVNYNVVSSVDPTDVRLLPTMTATVQIIVEEQTNVILVPNAAIAYGRSQAGAAPAASPAPTDAAGQPVGTPATVFVLRNGQAEPRQIIVGTSDSVNTQVLSGLEPGDQVITGVSAARATQTPGGQGIIPGPGSKPGGGQPKTGGGGGG